MALPSLNLSPRARVILAVTIAVVWLLLRHDLATAPDVRLTPLGFEVLLFYELRDYEKTAEAYRAYFREQLTMGWRPGDPLGNALAENDLRTAKEIAHAASSEKPDDITARMSLVKIAVVEQNLPEAERIVSEILEHDPDHPQALVWASIVYARSGKYSEASAAITRTLRNAQIAGDWISFLAVLDATGLLAHLPADDQPLALLAQYYRYLRIFEEFNGKIAIAYAERAIAAGRGVAEAYATMGMVHYRQGRREKALKAFLKAIEVNPRYPEGYWGAAMVYGDRGDLANQARMGIAAVQANPHDPSYLRNLYVTVVQNLGDAHQGVKLYQAAVEADPNNFRALNCLASTHAFLGDHSLAVQYYRRGLQLMPMTRAPYRFGFDLDDPIKVSGYLSDSLSDLGNVKEAQAVLQQAISIAPDRYEPYTQLADLYHRGGRYKDAVKQYQKAFELGEDDVESRSMYCVDLHLTKEYEQAVPCFKGVLAENPGDQRAQRMLPEAMRNLSLQRTQP